MTRSTAVLILAIVAPLALPAAPINLDRLRPLREVMDVIYRLQYDRAEALSRRLIERAPEDPGGYVFLARTYWSEILNRRHALSLDRFAAPDFFAETQKRKYKVDVDPADEARFEEMSRTAIEKASTALEADPDDNYSRFLLGLAYQNWAAFDIALKGSWWSAFTAGNRTYRYHRQVRRANPDFVDPLLAMGVYDYVAGSVPWRFRWLTVLFGFGGNKDQGRERLETAAREAILVADDAATILALIYTREKKYSQALEKLTTLGRKYPENFLFQLDRASLARRMDDLDLAVDILIETLRRIQDRAPGYQGLDRSTVYNQIGIAFREDGKLRAAANWFRICLNETEAGGQSRTIAHLELGKTLDLAGQRSDALAHYRNVSEAADFAGSREEAELLLRRPYR